MEAESEDDEFAFVQYIECVPSLDDMDETLMYAFLHWVSAGFAKEEHDVRERG